MLEKAAAMDKENQQQRHEEEVFRPSSSSRELCYLRSSSMDYRPRDVHEKSGLIHCPNIKMLVNDVAFLTERARDGDMVIYVGGTIGNYLPILGKMFPNLQFLVYDGNPTSMHYRSPQEEKASNIHLKPTWFSEKEARTLAAMRHPTPYDSSKTLLMVDSRNITKLALNQEDLLSSLPQSKSTGALRSIVTDENIETDLADQHAWVHALRPRAAMLKFRIPFSATGSPLSYFAGRLYLQPFAQRSSTEVRLCVDAEANADGSYSYPLASYPAQMHDGCLFHHNTIVRRQHLASPCRIKVSWDQCASHAVLNMWIERAMRDASLTGIEGGSEEAVMGARRQFVHEVMNKIDTAYGRTLGCRIDPVLREYVKQDNHMFRREKVEAFLQRKATKLQRMDAMANMESAGQDGVEP